jgi:hypothetical protein
MPIATLRRYVPAWRLRTITEAVFNWARSQGARSPSWSPTSSWMTRAAWLPWISGPLTPGHVQRVQLAAVHV